MVVGTLFQDAGADSRLDMKVVESALRQVPMSGRSCDAGIKRCSCPARFYSTPLICNPTASLLGNFSGSFTLRPCSPCDHSSLPPPRSVTSLTFRPPVCGELVARLLMTVPGADCGASK